MTVTLTIDTPTSRPARSFDFEVVWTGTNFRSLRLRILQEQGVELPDEATTCDLQRKEPQRVTVAGCLRDAGIRAHVARGRLDPAQTGPWHESDIFAELADIMQRNPSP